MSHLGLQTHAPTQTIAPVQSFPIGKLGTSGGGKKFRFKPGFGGRPITGFAPFALPGGLGILRAGKSLFTGAKLFFGKGTFAQRALRFGGGVLGFQTLQETTRATIEDRPLDIRNIVTPKAIATGVGLTAGGIVAGGFGALSGLGIGALTRTKQAIAFAGEALPPPDSSVSPFSFFGFPDPTSSTGSGRPPTPLGFRTPPIETNVNLGFPQTPAFATSGPSISPSISVSGGGGGIPLPLLLLLLGGAGALGFGIAKKKKKKKRKKKKSKKKRSRTKRGRFK